MSSSVVTADACESFHSSSGLTNRQIRQQIGNVSYSTVAKVYQRFSEELRQDKGLKKKVERIISNLSLVKG